MRLLIVEDEPYVAEYIEEKCRSILRNKILRIHRANTLEQALKYISQNVIDLCFLDLNLNGKNGYTILKDVVSRSFHTIIISAHTDQAVEAFQYGVLDFIPKPFTEQRLKAAFNRYFDSTFRKDISTKYLSVKVAGKIRLIHVRDITYFKASENYVEIHLNNKKNELLDKKMEHLEQILPANFVRIHRSFIVDISQIASFERKTTGAYKVELKDHTVLPLGKKRLKTFTKLFATDRL